MVKCLNKYGVSFETTHPSTEIKKKMPLWYHPRKNRHKRQVNNSQEANCLRQNHAVFTVGDGLEMIRRRDDPLHYDRASCECDACDDDKEIRGCENPHACIAAAASRLGQILPGWIPSEQEAEPLLQEATNETREEDRGYFEPPMEITMLAQGLRVMTLRPDEPKERIDRPVRRRAQVNPIIAAVEVYIAGAVHAPSSKRASAAAGIFFGEGDERNTGKNVPIADTQSQYVAEIYAALLAIRMT
ncbi:hypothetical protein C8J57DRAFT_952995, partial [Mycena rebaudengoi]